MYIFISKKKVIIIGLVLLAVVSFFMAYKVGTKVPTVAPDPIYQGDENEKKVSFAINVDWGEEYIPMLLDTLNKNNVKVTFFLTGRWTNKFPDLAKTIYDAGHEIGNHGYSHRSPNAMTYDENKQEIKDTEDAIYAATSHKTTLFAPPSGEREDTVLEAASDLGYQTILWTIDTVDWQKPSQELMLSRINEKLVNGGIILMHPTQNSVEGMNSFIKLIKSKDYGIVRVSDNIK